jgi:hypothetical protein
MKIVEAAHNTRPMIMLHGPAGIGKTDTMSKAPGLVTMQFEDGIPVGRKVMKLDIEHSHEGARGGIRDLLNESHQFTTLGIDTLDSWEPLVTDYVCKKHGWKNVDQPSYGRGYNAVEDEWRDIIRGFGMLQKKKGMTIVMTCHTQVIEVADPRAPSFQSFVPKLHRRARALLVDACDAVLFLSHDLRTITDNNDRTRATVGSGRHIFCVGQPAFLAKNRFGMPERIPFPADFQWSELSKFWEWEAAPVLAPSPSLSTERS